MRWYIIQELLQFLTIFKLMDQIYMARVYKVHHQHKLCSFILLNFIVKFNKPFSHNFRYYRSHY